MTFLGGGVVGTVLGHFLAIGRDKRNQKHANQLAREARRSSLQAFLNVWAADLDANRKAVNANNVLESMADRFDQKRRELITQATAVEADYFGNPRTKFNIMVDAIINMTPGGTEGEQGRQALLNAIRDLAAFVEKRS